MHTAPHRRPTPVPAPDPARDYDLLVRRLLSLADDLERHAGHGAQWQANISAATRIRHLAAPDREHRQPSLRDAMVAALTTTTTHTTGQAAA
ncbi:hypothetical protein ACIGZJ_30780 [Kitasatospora sp. NPDC052868]|uniref:hypothetical protein n=1 Tax=Kitasatospora sp. NPDC052868 TaxID=3364060 RepID=UPI0037CAF075